MSSVTTTLTGNVVNDLATFGSAENPGTRFRVAVNSRRKDRTGAWVDGNAYFVDVKCWGRLADNVKWSVRRGDPVIIAGRPETTDYTVDGQRRQSHEIIASFIGHDLTFGTSQFRKTSKPAQDGQERNGLQEPSAAAAPDPYAVQSETDEPVGGVPGDAGDLDQRFDEALAR